MSVLSSLICYLAWSSILPSQSSLVLSLDSRWAWTTQCPRQSCVGKISSDSILDVLSLLLFAQASCASMFISKTSSVLNSLIALFCPFFPFFSLFSRLCLEISKVKINKMRNLWEKTEKKKISSYFKTIFKTDDVFLMFALLEPSFDSS